MSENRIEETFGGSRQGRPTDWGAIMRAMRRGLAGKCPACGEGRLYRAYAKIDEECGSCGQDLYRHRADDAPAYFTIFIVGHIIIPLVLIAERMLNWDVWLHAVVWAPLTIGLTLLFLPWTKGALVGLQWCLGVSADGDERPDYETGQTDATGGN